jgi:hypothetical protein
MVTPQRLAASHGLLAQIYWQSIVLSSTSALPLKLSHPRSAACRWLRSDDTGQTRTLPAGEIAINPDVVWIAARSLTPVPSRTVRHRPARNGARPRPLGAPLVTRIQAAGAMRAP